MKTYQGGCHCGLVRFSVNADLSSVIHCNCSHCEKKGLLLVFVPASQFSFLQGEEALTSYGFNTKKIDHRFCKNCGVQPLGFGKNKNGEPTVAINTRCIDDIDISSLNLKPFDGKNWNG